MKTIVIIVFDGVEALDVTGPASVFSAANDLRPGSYRISLSTVGGANEVRSSSGITLGQTMDLGELDPAIDTLLVAGGSEAALFGAINSGIPSEIAKVSPSARRVGSICSGAFLLGAAGLLDGRRVTTHWRAASRLKAMFPACSVESDRIFCVDGVYTSAGVTAGIDLALQLVAEDYGDRLAMDVARELVVFLRRSGGQSQFSGPLAAQVDASPPIAQLIEWISDNPQASLRVAELAKRVSMSERNFNRTFTRETGSSPAKFVATIRLQHAQGILEATSWPLERVAERSGFGSVDALERSFRKLLGVSPIRYRERFAGPSQHRR
jgi:transcriptional regulator GlxA family with amidase domain